MTAARIWTLGDRLEYANGWQAEVAHVDDGDPHFAVVKKWRPGGGHYYETAHRDRPVPADDVADDTWSDPLEFDQGEFHTLDAAIAALPRAKGLTQ